MEALAPSRAEISKLKNLARKKKRQWYPLALRSKSHGPLSESRVLRRSEKLKISTPQKTVEGVKELDTIV